MSAEAIAADFEAMLASFRALGGTADNVTRREGALGLGLFPINPDEPVTLHVPERLLIDTKHVVLDGEDLVVDPACEVDADVRAFFNDYQKRFSWGAEGRTRVDCFEFGLKMLPLELRRKLEALRLVNFNERHVGDWNLVLLRRFIASRSILYSSSSKLMPLIELCNHSGNFDGYHFKNGISVRGEFSDEILVNYNPAMDPITRFCVYGFSGSDEVAFSLPMWLDLADKKSIMIGNAFDQVILDGSYVLAKHEIRDHVLRLAHMKIGQKNAPRVPRTVVRRVLKTFPQPLADEIFDRVRSGNLLALADLLEAADGAPGEVAAGLRAAIRWQLKAMSQSFGAREAAQSKFVSESIL